MSTNDRALRRKGSIGFRGSSSCSFQHQRVHTSHVAKPERHRRTAAVIVGVGRITIEDRYAIEPWATVLAANRASAPFGSRTNKASLEAASKRFRVWRPLGQRLNPSNELLRPHWPLPYAHADRTRV